MDSSAPRLLDQLRDKIRVKHYSIRTESAYVDWTRRFILFHGKRHPRDLGSNHVEAFLTHLAVERKVAASTQGQAKSALLFLYREVLGVALPWLDNVEKAKMPARLPVVLSQGEVHALLDELSGTPGLMARLMYGTGMRLMECLRLRVKDVDFVRHEIMVREGKGARDRVTMLPESIHCGTAACTSVESAEAASARLEQGIWGGVSAVCLGAKVPSCWSRMALAVRVPIQNDIDRSSIRCEASPSRRREIGSTVDAAGASKHWTHETSDSAHTAPLLCHTFARGRVRHSDRSGVARSQGRIHDDDLHARAESRGSGSAEPARPLLRLTLAVSICDRGCSRCPTIACGSTLLSCELLRPFAGVERYRTGGRIGGSPSRKRQECALALSLRPKSRAPRPTRARTKALGSGTAVTLTRRLSIAQDSSFRS